MHQVYMQQNADANMMPKNFFNGRNCVIGFEHRRRSMSPAIPFGNKYNCSCVTNKIGYRCMLCKHIGFVGITQVSWQTDSGCHENVFTRVWPSSIFLARSSYTIRCNYIVLSMLVSLKSMLAQSFFH